MNGPLTVTDPDASRLIRLTGEEWVATIRNVFGLEVSADDWPQDAVWLGYEGNKAVLATGIDVELMLAAAKAVSDKVDVAPLMAVACRSGGSCKEAFIALVGETIFRRPLLREEAEIIGSSLTGEGLDAQGARALIEAMLAAPQFIYQMRTGEPG